MADHLFDTTLGRSPDLKRTPIVSEPSGKVRMNVLREDDKTLDA